MFFLNKSCLLETIIITIIITVSINKEVHIYVLGTKRRNTKGVELLGQCKTVGSKKQLNQVNYMKLSVYTGVCPCVFGMLETESRCRSPLLKCNAKGILIMLKQVFFFNVVFCCFCFLFFFASLYVFFLRLLNHMHGIKISAIRIFINGHYYCLM